MESGVDGRGRGWGRGGKSSGLSRNGSGMAGMVKGVGLRGGVVVEVVGGKSSRCVITQYGRGFVS